MSYAEGAIIWFTLGAGCISFLWIYVIFQIVASHQEFMEKLEEMASMQYKGRHL